MGVFLSLKCVPSCSIPDDPDARFFLNVTYGYMDHLVVNGPYVVHSYIYIYIYMVPTFPFQGGKTEGFILRACHISILSLG